MRAALAVFLLAAAPVGAGDLAEVKSRGALRVLAVVVNQDNIAPPSTTTSGTCGAAHRGAASP